MKPRIIYVSQASRRSQIPRRYNPDVLTDRNHDPRLIAQAHELYLQFFGDTHAHPQTRSVSVQGGEGQSIDRGLGKHGQGTHKPSLTSPADAFPFGTFCARGNYCRRCEYNCEEVNWRG